MPEFHPSPELEAIARRWIRAMVSKGGETMTNLLSSSDPLLFCGSAENEVWEGAFFRDSYATHIDENPHGDISNERAEAWDCGETGWALWTGRLAFKGNDSINPARITLVFVLEKGIWKVQHVHNSWARANFEMLGIEHTALDELMRAAQSSKPDLGRSGSATVMFTDIADSTALAEALGDTRWANVVQDHVALIAEHLAHWDGRLIKSLGDGTMSTFASAGAAKQAALAIQSAMNGLSGEPKLQVRIGLHTGDVVEAGEDFFGTVVNKAARIATAARPGEIRVSDATRAMVGGNSSFRFCDPFGIPLRGLEGEHRIYRLEWPS